MSSVFIGSLDVDLQTPDAGESVAHSFPNRRMRVNHVHHIVDGAFQVQSGGCLGKDFGCQRADDVDAQHLSVFFLADDFDEAAVAAQDGRFAVAHEGEFPDLHGVSGFARLLFGQADRADLRLTVGSVRYAGFQHRLRGLSGDVGDRDNTLHHRGVRQLWHARNNITDSEQSLLVCFHVGTGVDEAALDLGFRFLQAAIFRHWFTADRKEQLFRLDRLRLAVLVLKGNGHAFGVFLGTFHLGAGENLNVFLLKGFLKLSGNFFILNGDYARQHLQNRHLRAERVVNGRELHANGAGADDYERFGNLWQLQNGTIGDDRFMVRFNARQGPRLRAADQQDVGRLDGRFLSIVIHADPARAFIAAPALNPFDFVFLEQKLDALGVFLYDLVFAFEDIGPVDLHAADFKTQFAGILEVVVNVGVVQKHLGRDTTDVQACAPEVRVFLHDNGFQTDLAGADGRDISSGTTPDDRHIIFCHSYSPSGGSSDG